MDQYALFGSSTNGRDKWSGSLFKEIIADTSPNVRKERVIQVPKCLKDTERDESKEFALSNIRINNQRTNRKRQF